MDIDTICQKLVLKVVLKEPHPIATTAEEALRRVAEAFDPKYLKS
jgi:hypothetical protein